MAATVVAATVVAATVVVKAMAVVATATVVAATATGLVTVAPLGHRHHCLSSEIVLPCHHHLGVTYRLVVR